MNLDYDLKQEMLKSDSVQECLNDILGRIQYPLSLEEIFEAEHPLERYLLFRVQGALGIGFDCDTTALVRDFFQKHYGYTGSSFDTLLSMQYLWGSVLRSLWKKDTEQVYFPTSSQDYLFLKEQYGYFKDATNQKIYRIDQAQKYIYELAHLSEIREALSEKLWEHFSQFSLYYHSIGNMSPCPDGSYNCEKGSYLHSCFDRLDLFIQTDFFQQHTEWVDWFSKYANTYLLQDFMAPNLPSFPMFENNNTVKYIHIVCQCIDTLLLLIQKRGENLLTK